MQKKPVVGRTKNTAKKPSIGTDTKRKTKTGKTIPRVNNKPAQPRFYDVKIRISAEEFARGLPFFEGQKYLQKFALDAYREKIKRAEAHDKEAKQKSLVSNMALLLPVIQEAHSQKKLDFLFAHGGEHGKTREA